MAVLGHELSKLSGYLFKALITFAGLSSCLKADLVVNVQDASIPAGGRGFVDVFVQSNAADTFSLFNYKFEITPVTITGGGILEFQASSTSNDVFKQLATEQALPNYVFNGSAIPDNFFAIRQDAITRRDQLVGGDVRVGGNFTYNTTGTYVLARLELQHITPNPAFSSGTYRVSLIQDPNLSYFQNLDIDDNDPAQPDIAANSYSTGNSGLVTIVAVPEPSSVCLLLASSSVVFGRFLRWLGNRRKEF
jgi:hypothetical protein